LKNTKFKKGIVLGIGFLFVVILIATPAIGYKNNYLKNIEPASSNNKPIDKGAALEIEIFGGFHTGAFIRNIGDTDALLVYWNITVEGGLLKPINVSNSGGVGSLPPYSNGVDLRITLPSDKLQGFGKIKIKVTADSLLTSQIEKEADAFLLLFYMIILPD